VQEPEGSSLHSQQPATSPYPVPVKSNTDKKYKGGNPQEGEDEGHSVLKSSGHTSG
jgi:hypothetical protein